MNKSEQINELASALAKARQSFGVIVKDKIVEVATRSGGKYRFNYAPLENIIDAVIKPLGDNGLVVTQGPVDGGIETMLLHSSGQWMSHVTPMVIVEGSAQGFGSAMTYARRYGITSMLCIASEDDDDANLSDGNKMRRRTGKDDGKVTPTAGTFESLPESMQEWLQARASEIVALHDKEGAEQAYKHYHDAVEQMAEFEEDGKMYDCPTQQAALRSILPSNVKTALRKHAEQKKG